jgi:hypothetical protein
MSLTNAKKFVMAPLSPPRLLLPKILVLSDSVVIFLFVLTLVLALCSPFVALWRLFAWFCTENCAVLVTAF